MTARNYLRTHAIAAFCLIVSFAENGRSDPPGENSVAMSEFVSGAYSLPFGFSATCSTGMTAKAITFLRAMEAQDDAQLRKLQAVDVELWNPAIASHHSLLEWQDMMVLCQACLNTETALTVVLIFADKASRWEKGRFSLKPIESALNRLITEFPDTWQAQAAPMFLSRFKFIGSVDDAEVKYIQAAARAKEMLGTLTDTAPDHRNGEELAGMAGIEFPLRAWYLKGIAASYYQAATSGRAISLEALQCAQEACQQMIQEYSGSKQADWAKEMADRLIPGIRELADLQ